jgi:hypothetical protein
MLLTSICLIHLTLLLSLTTLLLFQIKSNVNAKDVQLKRALESINRLKAQIQETQQTSQVRKERLSIRFILFLIS